MKKFQLAIAQICLVFVSLALAVQLSMVVLSFTNPKLATQLSKEAIWILDERFN